MGERGSSGGVTGVLHLHTTYSDGAFTPAELRQVLLADGCAFAGLTDHAEALDAGKLAEYVRECEALSDERFVLLPGLEFSCDARMHLLGYGCTSLSATQDPVQVVAHIRATGGIAVLAHPLEEHLSLLGRSDFPVHGVEVWNTKYDGRYAPRIAPFERVQRLRTDGVNLRAFFGLDLHWKSQFRGLQTVLLAGPLSRDGLLTALRTGAFVGSADGVRLSSDGGLAPALRERFAKAHRRSDRIRRWLKGAKRVADRLGLKVPTALKNQIRRIM